MVQQVTSQNNGHANGFPAAIQRYLKDYNNISKGNHKDFSISKTERHEVRNDYSRHVRDYYDFMAKPYEMFWGQLYQYAAIAPGDTIDASLRFTVHRIALLMGLKPGMKVLEIGCGIGGPTREVAKFIGCEVIGVNITEWQINRAIELTLESGLSHLCTFIRADYMDLPFPDGYFDAVFGLQATCHAPSLAHVYSQANRVLKSGGVLGITEWVMLDAPAGRFDINNTEHTRIRNKIEAGNGTPCLQTISYARDSIQRAGFDLDYDQDCKTYFDKFYDPPPIVYTDSTKKTIESFSPIPIPNRTPDHDGTLTYYYAPIPQPPYPKLPNPKAIKTHPIPPIKRSWYTPLLGTSEATSLQVSAEDRWKVNMMSHKRRARNRLLIKILAGLRIIDPAFVGQFKTLEICVDSVVESEELWTVDADGASRKGGLFTPNWMFVCKKVRQPEAKLLEVWRSNTDKVAGIAS